MLSRFLKKTASCNSMPKTYRLSLFAAYSAVGLLGLFALSTSAQAANQLQQIDANALPGDQVQLRLKLSDSAPQPLTFTVDNPARISLDLADTSIALPSRRIDVKRGVLDTVNVAEANGRTRVVLNLNTMVPYETRVEGDTVIVTVGSNVQANGWLMGDASNGYAYIAPQYVRQQLGYVWNTFKPTGGIMITEFDF